MFDLQVIQSMAICTKQEQIYTVIWYMLILRAKKYGPGWVDGWMGGWMDGWMVKPG